MFSPSVILSEVIVRNADDNAVEEPALSEAEGTPYAADTAQQRQGILPVGRTRFCAMEARASSCND